MRLRLAVPAAALAVGLLGIVAEAVRVGAFLVVAQGEEVLVPASAALAAVGAGGLLLVLARGRASVAALGLGGVAAILATRLLTDGPFAQTARGVFIPYREDGSPFAWSLAWSLALGPALGCAGATLVLFAVVTVLARLARRVTRRTAAAV